MKRNALFAVFAVVAVLAATMTPEVIAAVSDPQVLLHLAVAGGLLGMVGDIQFVTSKELRSQRAELAEANKKLLVQIGAEKDAARVKELEGEWDKRDADIDRLTAQIARAEKQERTDEEGKKPAQERRSGRELPGQEQEGTADERQKRYKAAFYRYLSTPMEMLSDEERSILRTGWQVAGERRDGMSTTSASGGYTIPTDLFPSLQEDMLAFGGARAMATILTTSGGGTINIPTVSDVSTKAQIIGEGSSLTSPQDVSFGVVALGAFMYRSLLPVTYELMQDSAFNMEGYIRSALATRVHRGTNVHFTTGNGSTTPKGFMAAASSGATAASATNLAYTDMVNLEHSVDPAYRTGPKVGWTFADSTLKVLKKMVDSQNRPLWLPGVAVREPDLILGYRYVINQDMAAVQASNKSVAFGDWSKFVIRDVNQLLVVRANEKFIDQAMVGFYVFSRHDSDMVDAGTDPVKYLTHPSPD